MTVQTAFDTLFLDRDGVINVLRPHDYVKSWDEFEFTDGAIEALRMLSPLFRHIVVVTNQRGVGKGVMTEEALRTKRSPPAEAGSTQFTTVPTGTKTARTGSRIPVWPCKPAGTFRTSIFRRPYWSATAAATWSSAGESEPERC